MRKLTEILAEKQFNLSNTEKAIIASMSISPTPEMSYGVVTGARNSVTARKQLEAVGLINVDDETKTAELTSAGTQVLTYENLTDEAGELTDRGKELVDRYKSDIGEWKKFESFKRFT
jgi:predicted transcriptional regulator